MFPLYLSSSLSGKTMTIARMDPRDVPTYKHLESSKSFLFAKLSEKNTAVTPSDSTIWSRLLTEELRDLEREFSSAELPVPALFERLFATGDFTLLN